MLDFTHSRGANLSFGVLSRVGRGRRQALTLTTGLNRTLKCYIFPHAQKTQNCGSVFMLGCVWYARKLPTKIGLEALVEIVVFYIKL